MVYALTVTVVYHGFRACVVQDGVVQKDGVGTFSAPAGDYNEYALIFVFDSSCPRKTPS